jgi:hypothetical protein
MRALFGIAEVHSKMASAMHAARLSAVSSSWANATVGRIAINKPTAGSIPQRNQLMTIPSFPIISRPRGSRRKP